MEARAPRPCLDLSPGEVRREWRRMRGSPIGPARPVVIITGWRAPLWPSRLLARRLRALTGGPAAGFYPLANLHLGSFARIVERVTRLVARRWPGERADETARVDVIAISMGGLIARAAALEEAGLRPAVRLNIARLFTLGTPHRGAKLSLRFAPDMAARDMRPGSAFLERLDGARRGYELICYARLRDRWVGATRTAPPGEEPIWTTGPRLLSHETITGDRRIVIDIARRLRGEEPVARPGCPPPRD